MAAPRGVGKLALGVRPRAGASLKFATHFQGQPFGVPAHGHADCHRSCSQILNSGGDRWTENCLMRVRVTNNDARKSHKTTEEMETKMFFPQYKQTASPLGCISGWLLVLRGKSGS